MPEIRGWAGRLEIDAATAVPLAGEMAVPLQQLQVVLHGAEGVKAATPGDFLLGRGITLPGGIAGDEVEDFFLFRRHRVLLAHRKKDTRKFLASQGVG